MSDEPDGEPPTNASLGRPELDPFQRMFQAQRLISQLFGIHESTRVEHFELDRELGRGAMGVVYLAYDHELDRWVAIKTLLVQGDPERRRMLEDEARAMAKIQHPNVVMVHEVGSTEVMTFIVMEHVEGVTLKDWLGKARSQAEVLRIFCQAGEGLAAAHAKGVIHRDFKPANVMIDREGRVRVMDFGLARKDPSHDETLLGTDVAPRPEIAGTPVYMAPEQFEGKIHPASDQYGFCVALYEALYDEHPFGGRSYPRMREAAERGEVRAPPESSNVPDWLRRIVVQGLACDPRNRFKSMRELLDAIAVGEPPKQGDRLRLRVTFSRDYADFDDAERTRLQELLRLVTRDPELAIESVYRGSLIVEFEVSAAGGARFLELQEAGVLLEELEMEVLSVEILSVHSDDEFYRRHADLIIRHFRGLFSGGIEDLVHETFVRFFESKGRVMANPRARLFGIAHDIALQHVRRLAHERQVDPDIESMAALDPGPSTLAARRREHRMVVEALRRLPLHHQEAVQLYCWAGLRIEEIAAIMGITPSGMRDRMAKARQLLARYLADLDPDSDVDALLPNPLVPRK